MPDARPDTTHQTSGPFLTARLPRDRAHPFTLVPDAETRAAMAADLGLSGLRKLRFTGALHPLEGGGWELRAELGATVVQPCRVTLAPVTTRIDEPVRRRYLPDWRDPARDAAPDSEIEAPDDPDTEALPPRIDPAAVMAEALALAIPPFPRAPEADAGPDTPAAAASPDDAASTHRPFAGLAHLRDRLRGDGND